MRMTVHLFRICLLASILISPSGLVSLADEVIETVEFDGDTISVVQTKDGEKAVMLGDRELGRNWFAGIDRVTTISGEPVALFYLGDGGNACGPSTLIVWRNDEGMIEALNYSEGCDTPSPAISDNGIYFVPYLNPGGERALTRWSKYRGIETMGMIRYLPEPGTGWEALSRSPVSHPFDFFTNEAVYSLAAGLLGDELQSFASGLQVASAPERLPSGILIGSGCVPHNCGSADAFIAVDEAAKMLYMAQQSGAGYKYWPSRQDWPQRAVQAFEAFTSAR